MYRVAIVDDLSEDAEALARYVRSADATKTGGRARLDVTCFGSPDELDSLLDRGYEPDVAFFDIVFDPSAAEPAADGVSAAGRLLVSHPRTQVVYTSGYDSFHTRVYCTPHAAYLRKPFRAEDVSYALDLALAALERRAERPLLLHSKGTDRVVAPADIRFLESRLHVVTVHTARGTIEVYGKLSDLLDLLPARFVRCHQSFAVNLDAVDALEASSLSLVSGERVPVSRRMRPAVREALFSHLRGSGR